MQQESQCQVSGIDDTDMPTQSPWNQTWQLSQSSMNLCSSFSLSWSLSSLSASFSPFTSSFLSSSSSSSFNDRSAAAGFLRLCWQMQLASSPASCGVAFSLTSSLVPRISRAFSTASSSWRLTSAQTLPSMSTARRRSRDWLLVLLFSCSLDFWMTLRMRYWVSRCSSTSAAGHSGMNSTDSRSSRRLVRIVLVLVMLRLFPDTTFGLMRLTRSEMKRQASSRTLLKASVTASQNSTSVLGSSISASGTSETTGAVLDFLEPRPFFLAGGGAAGRTLTSVTLASTLTSRSVGSFVTVTAVTDWRSSRSRAVLT
mmetsp:Transcript_18773/g.36733  ORF Transcript_18773/g.36733 Transcript_18773/m.36733 type:complete len:313 (-) Transcript_18773:2047-2985(-)